MINTAPIRGDFPSLKLGRMVRYHSTIERDLLYFLEYREGVVWYQEQPLTIKWQQPNGQLRHYTPDYEIHESQAKYIVECKPEAKLQGTHAKQQRQIGEAWCEANGYHFVTYTDTELRTGHTLENLKLLWRYARITNVEVLKKRILSASSFKAGSVTVSRLSQELGLPLQEIIPIVCYLLFHHELWMEMNQPFSLTTILTCEGQCNGTH